jgi:hypothetical protein
VLYLTPYRAGQPPRTVASSSSGARAAPFGSGHAPAGISVGFYLWLDHVKERLPPDQWLGICRMGRRCGRPGGRGSIARLGDRAQRPGRTPGSSECSLRHSHFDAVAYTLSVWQGSRSVWSANL